MEDWRKGFALNCSMHCNGIKEAISNYFLLAACTVKSFTLRIYDGIVPKRSTLLAGIFNKNLNKIKALILSKKKNE